VYGSNGTVGTHSTALTSGATIIIGRKGSFGEIHYSTEPCWPIDTTYYVDYSSTDCNLKWLSYRITSLGLKALNRAAAVPGLNRDDAYRQEFLLPPLSDQQRIAEVLDRVESLRVKRRKAIALLDDLAQSIFLDMFGNPDQSWLRATVEDAARDTKGAIRTGPFGSQLLHGEFVDSGVSVLGIDNAVANEFQWRGRRFITEEKYKGLVRYTVYPGDVLITIMGTCGRCAVVPDDIPVAINTKHLCCITLNRSRCLPEFLHSYFLMHPGARPYLSQAAKGAVMDGLNMAIIKRLPIMLPPIDLQQAFVNSTRALRAIKMTNKTHLAELDVLFASVQHRAFRGELWAGSPAA
jgi:type I restriction enzyme, S subunit